MGAAVPQVITTDRASSSLVIDGSLKFDSSKSTHLTRTPSSVGNRRTWTWSAWVKRNKLSERVALFTAATDNTEILFEPDDKLRIYFYPGSYAGHTKTNASFRDTSAWYHIVFSVDTNQSGNANISKIYVNGVQQEVTYPNDWTQNGETNVNNTVAQYIGSRYGPGRLIDAQLSNVYLIDGQALGPENFGFTDPLTNTWKPKKYNVPKADTVLVGTPTYASSDFKTTGDKTSDQTGLSFSSWSGSYTGAETKLFKNSTDSAFTLNINLVGGTTDRYLWGSNNLTNWTYIANAGARYYQLSGYKYYATSEGSSSTALQAVAENGPNSFYLPFDGNSPIDQDKSGNGNNWEPVNFGGSVALDSDIITGGRPILNTTQGGAQAGVGVFGSLENKYYTVTTANGSVYQFDITSGDNPSLEFIRGATYRFDYTSHASHPLRFSSTNPDSSTTAYTEGTNTSVSNVITITVPHDAPDTLYYYCTAHASAMNGSISVTTDNTKADQYASNCVIALPLVGANSDVCASIACTATTKVMTNVGNAAASSDTSNFYRGSFEFDGSGDRVTAPAGADFAFGTDDFTIETWMNFSTVSSSADHVIVDFRPANSAYTDTFTFSTDRNNGFKIYTNDNLALGGNAPAVGKWHHIALVRNSGALQVFVDGIGAGSVSSGHAANNFSRNGAFKLGGLADGAASFTGYQSDVRIYKGVAKYTSDFVVSSPSPVILPDTPSGVSGGSKLAKITDGAVAFDGSGDYLSVTGPGTLAASSNWCMECTFYCTGDASGTYRIMGANESSESSEYLQMRIRLGQYQFYTENANTLTGTAAFNKWTHMALTKSGTTVRAFVDGKQLWSTTDNNADDITTLITGWGYGSEYFPGFISNARFVNGSSVYTADFTPPSAPLTNITNTYLLCCQSNTSAISVEVTPGTFSNSGTTYSSNVSGAVAGSPYDATKMFDGSISTYTDHNAQNSTITWTQTLTSVTSLRVYIHGGNSTNTVTTVGGSGTQVDTISTDFGPGWHNIVLGTTGSTINSIAFARGGSGNFLSIYAVEVNGTILIDNFYGKAIARAGDAAATNFNPFNTDINTVRGQETGYATLNPLATQRSGSITLSDGNLKATVGSTRTSAYASLPFVKKMYYELTFTNSAYVYGMAVSTDFNSTANSSPQRFIGESGGSYGVGNDGTVYNNGSSIGTVSSFAVNDCMGWAYDSDSGEFTIFKNGVNLGSFTASTSRTYYPAVSLLTSGAIAEFNFGQKPFKFPPPDGFRPLNTANTRPVKVISRPDQYVGVATYTSGNGSAVSVNSYNFAPELLWFKDRDGGNNWAIFDTVRGKFKLVCDNAGNESDASSQFSSFDDNGFTLTSTTSDMNRSTNQICSWGWKAGGNPGISTTAFWKDDQEYASAAAAGMNGGSITPIGASVGTKQGFSIITYRANLTQGATISHGLTQKPDFAIFKNRDSTLGNNEVDWGVYHSAVGASNKLELNQNFDKGAFPGPFNNTEPTSSVFTFGGGSQGHSYLTNGPSGDRFVGYIWHNVPGLQKFGSFEGNTNADGPFVELGFRPSIVLLKAIDDNANWMLYDNKRGTSNPNNFVLGPNVIDGGSTYDGYSSAYPIDFLSNGFKVRTNVTNSNSNTVIYMAWAEAPSVDLYGGGANAR